MRPPSPLSQIILILALMVAAGCSKTAVPPESAVLPKHHHHPPHGGTPVVLGDEAYHLELVLEASAGKIDAYVLDGEMENFVRSTAPALVIDATVAGNPQRLSLAAVPNPETGETLGDTALFEGQAGWLQQNPSWDGTVERITIRDTTYTDVKFNFPKGNDGD